MREPAVVSSPRVQRMSLSAIGTPCSPLRPSRSSASASASATPGAGAQEACRSPSSPLDPVEVGLGQLAAGHLAARRAARRSARPSGRASSIMRRAAPGTRRPARPGAPPSTSSRGHEGRGSSGRVTFDQLERVRRRWHARQVELLQRVDVAEDAGQLLRPSGSTSSSLSAAGRAAPRAARRRRRSPSGEGYRRPVAAPEPIGSAARPRRGVRRRGRRSPAGPCCPARPRTRPAGPRPGVAIAVRLDLAVVDEHVLARLLGDEAEALLVAEPLHGAYCQRVALLGTSAAGLAARTTATIEHGRRRCNGLNAA